VAWPEPDFPEPGQFFEISTGDGLERWIRRPMAFYRTGRGFLSFLFRVVGEGTRWLAARRPGDRLDVLGPLGRGFPLDAPGPHALVGGGTGVPVLWELARRLGGQRVVIAIGGRSAPDVAMADDFRGLGEVRVATEDGSVGTRGTAVDILPPDGTVYACGPEGMLRAVKAHSAGRRVYLSLEARMGCGFGACLGCTVERAVPPEADPYLRYVRVCVEGPVFPAEAVRL
jgi:dihydroorotate dehydrogenase electron transfer subunit